MEDKNKFCSQQQHCNIPAILRYRNSTNYKKKFTALIKIAFRAKRVYLRERVRERDLMKHVVADGTLFLSWPLLPRKCSMFQFIFNLFFIRAVERLLLASFRSNFNWYSIKSRVITTLQKYKPFFSACHYFVTKHICMEFYCDTTRDKHSHCCAVVSLEERESGRVRREST